MKGPCLIVPYITPSGQSPILDFLERLKRFEAKAYAKYLYVYDLISRNGTDIPSSHWTFVGDGLGEMRWKGRKVNYRIYCSEESQSRIVQYEGVRKTWAAFENSDKDLCTKRRQDFQSPDYDQEVRHYRYLAKQNPNAGNR